MLLLRQAKASVIRTEHRPGAARLLYCRLYFQSDGIECNLGCHDTASNPSRDLCMTNNVPYILWLSANERVERVFGDGFCSGFLDGALQNGPCLLFVAGTFSL